MTDYINRIKGLYIQDTKLKNNVIEKNNTITYNPTQNYHPATKKYVDDTKLKLINDTNKSKSTSYSSKKIDELFGAIEKTLLGILGIRIVSSVSLIKNPNKTNYREYDYFEADGVEIKLTFEDGTTEIVNNVDDIIEPSQPLSINDTSVNIEYSFQGTSYFFSIPITVEAFSEQFTLIDFNFITNSDGTYTLTEWRGTLNGVPSTEVVIPNNSKVIL